MLMFLCISLISSRGYGAAESNLEINKIGKDYNFITLNDSTLNKTKRIRWMLSIPYVNSFLLRPIDESVKTNTGFWGLSGGIEYKLSKNKFLRLKFNAASDFFLPIPASPGIEGEYESMNSIYFSLDYNKNIKSISFGSGLSYSFNNWSIRDLDQTPTVTLKDYSGQSIGLILSTYVESVPSTKFSRRILIGIIYKPNIIRVVPEIELKYEHLISLEFSLRFG